MTRGPGALRAFWILVRMAVRKKRNRFRWTQENSWLRKAVSRTATAPRKERGGCLLWIFAVAMLWNSGFMTSKFLREIEARSPEYTTAYHDWKREVSRQREEKRRQEEALRLEQEAALRARWIPVERCIRKTWPSRSDLEIEDDRRWLLPELWKQISDDPMPEWLEREHRNRYKLGTDPPGGHDPGASPELEAEAATEMERQKAALQARWIPEKKRLRKAHPSLTDEAFERLRRLHLPLLWEQISDDPIPDWVYHESWEWLERELAKHAKPGEPNEPEPEPEPDAETTARIQAGALALRSTAVGVLLVLLVLTLVFISLGTYNRDLGQVGWSLAWLYTFPVPARALFLARLGEYAFSNFVGWFVFLPFFLVYFLREGCGVVSILLAPAAALFLNLIMAAVQLVSETWLRQHLDRSRLKNVQAVCTVMGCALAMGVYSLALTLFGPDLLLSIPSALRSTLAWTPPGLPALLVRGGDVAWPAGAGMLIVALLVTAGAVAGVYRLTRSGLIRESNPYRGTRRPGADHGLDIARPRWFRGVVLKDLRLLWRDRNLFVQTLVVPVILLGFQVVVNPGLLEAISSNFQHASATAFGLGAYTLTFSALNSLLVEGQSVWLLFTLPVRLERILLRKAFLWGTFASLLPAALLAFSLFRLESFKAVEVSYAVYAIAGIFGYAIIATHLGALGTRMFETDVRRRTRPSTFFFFMLLAGLYVVGFYLSSNTIVSLWIRIVLLGLCGMLALAYWQKVSDNAPFLLDPASRPAWRLSLVDGLIAVLFFFVLHGLLTFCFHGGSLTLWTSVTVSYMIAGGVVSLVFLFYVAVRSQGRRLDPPGGRKQGVLRTGLVGLVLGLAAGVGGLGYLTGIEWFEPISRLLQGANDLFSAPGTGRVVLAVCAAPLVEEYIFRGLVYRGLRRSTRPAVAAFASAAIFALVHPLLSMPPVFVLGLFAALAYERTGRLAAPILVHAVYNAVVLWPQTW